MKNRLMLAFSALLALSSVAAAEKYPAHPIRVIVPLSAGSLTDTLVRGMSAKMSALLGQPLIVEDMPGAGGIVGSVAAAKSAPNGYTIAVAVASSFSVNPHLHKSLAYNPVKDFAPICLMGGGTYVLAVNASLGVKTLPQLLDRAKTKTLAFASAGAGTTTHLAQEMLKARVGVSFLHVPYKGGAQAITDTVAGHSDLLFETPGPLLSQIQAGKLIPLAVMSPHRASSLPNVPTFDELGYSGLYLEGWSGLVAPAGTPAAIVNLLAEACQSAVAAPDIKEQGRALGFDFDYLGPSGFAAFISSELPKWGKLVKMAGVPAE